MCMGGLEKCPLFLSDFNGNFNFFNVLKKIEISKFHNNHSSRSGLLPCGRTDRLT